MGGMARVAQHTFVFIAIELQKRVLVCVADAAAVLQLAHQAAAPDAERHWLRRPRVLPSCFERVEVVVEDHAGRFENIGPRSRSPKCPAGRGLFNGDGTSLDGSPEPSKARLP